jgi:hypothetical protein
VNHAGWPDGPSGTDRPATSAVEQNYKQRNDAEYINGAQALFKALTDAGLDTCFANPGTSAMQLVY